ncbi:MAG: tetratricopeptide repeat protein [Candidatus Sumerlaeaceae bacterium]
MEHSYQAEGLLVVARTYFEKGFEAQRQGDFVAALGCYQKSIETRASAEAYCYMGWTYSFLGQYEKAIRACMKAIEVDPDFGNPYNDIGAYLIEMGRYEDSLPWLRKATRAQRYECAHYPWYNMGKVYERTGNLGRARDAYARALHVYRGYPLAVEALIRVLAALN